MQTSVQSSSNIPNQPVSRAAFWTGHVLSFFPIAMLVLSAVMKLAKLLAVVKGFDFYGIPAQLIVGLGALELACAIIYIIPRTAVLGAILVTGYLGGAIATNVRILNWEFIMPAILAVFAWLGLFLRDHRLRALIPLRS